MGFIFISKSWCRSEKGLQTEPRYVWLILAAIHWGPIHILWFEIKSRIAEFFPAIQNCIAIAAQRTILAWVPLSFNGTNTMQFCRDCCATGLSGNCGKPHLHKSPEACRLKRIRSFFQVNGLALCDMWCDKIAGKFPPQNCVVGTLIPTTWWCEWGLGNCNPIS